MKYLATLLLCVAPAFCADLVSGEAARAVIGQPTFTAQNAASPASTLGGVSGIAYANGTLFVTGANRLAANPMQNRVVIYHNINQKIGLPNAVPPAGSRCSICFGLGDTIVGQPDASGVDPGLSATQLNLPTAVASDGHILAVADTNNNRVLIWNTIPSSNNQPANVVLGQADFTHVQLATTDQKSFRGPQGVWIQGTRLFVADTGNNRIMVWNTIPTSNFQPADLELGQPDFTTVQQISPTDPNQGASSSNMLSPTSATSDGQRLYVADLGHNRVMIWNTIPSANNAPADVVVGQPDFKSAPTKDSNGTDNNNNVSALCPTSGTDSNGNPIYPARCWATLNFPRFALSDGTRLYIADTGNDRVLVFNNIPTQNGQNANIVLGQQDQYADLATDSTDTFRPDNNQLHASTNTLRSPLAVAWDGTNLYVTDPFDLRVLVFSPGENWIQSNGVKNAASLQVYAIGTLTLTGTINAGDTVTLTINSATYTYTVVKTDSFDSVAQGLATAINSSNSGAGDPGVLASIDPGFGELVLTARTAGPDGNNITYSVTTSTSAQITATTGGANMAGGQDAAEVAPGTLISIFGNNLSTKTESAAANLNQLPHTLGGTQVFIDGIAAPLTYVSPTQINAQIPYDVYDGGFNNSSAAWVLVKQPDGTLVNSAPVNLSIVGENPGIFAGGGADPRPAFALHASSFGLAVISVDGSITAGNVATVTVAGTAYNYTVQAADTLSSVVAALVKAINANSNSPVTASAASLFTRIILTAKQSGPAGNGIAVSATQSTNATVLVTALGSGVTCCSNGGGAVTEANPASPGEVIIVYATGLGMVTPLANTGQVIGNTANSANISIDALAGGSTANTLFDGLVPDQVGIHAVWLQLASTLPTNKLTQLTIAQDVFVSNIVTIPVKAP